MRRVHITLGGLLVLQLLLILVLRSPFTNAARPSDSRALIPQLESITAAKLELDGPEGKQLTLEKEVAGWVIDDLDGFPADEDKVEELVEDLRDMRVRRPVVASRRYHDKFKVGDDDFEGRLKIWSSGSSDPEVDLILGSSSNYRSLHVRNAGEDAVYEVRGLASYDVRPDASTWAEKQLVDVAAEDIVGLELTNRSGTFSLARADGKWSVVSPESQRGRTPDPQKLDALLEAARSIRIADPAGALDEAAQGLSPAVATLKIKYRRATTATEEGGEGTGGEATDEVEVRIGRNLDDDASKRYITRSGFDFCGTIWDSSIDKLIEQKADDLLTSEKTASS